MEKEIKQQDTEFIKELLDNHSDEVDVVDCEETEE